jgi:hypothetical protein
MFSPESTLGTWVAPAYAMPVRTANVQATQPLMLPGETGAGRADIPGRPGEVGASGQIVSTLHPLILPRFLRSVFGDRRMTAVAGVPAGFRNILGPNDDVAFESFSIQERYRPDLALNFRGCKIGGFVIAATVGQFATCQLDIVGKDASITGGLWTDGSPAPDVVDPVPYVPMPSPLTFYEGVMRLGGSVAVVNGELVVTGGVARNDFDAIDITGAFNVTATGFGVNLGDRTSQSIDEGVRAITTKFSPNFALATSEFWVAWKNGAPAIVELFFQSEALMNAGSDHWEMKITLPYVQYSNAAMPQVARQYGLRRIQVAGEAKADPVANMDWGMVIQGTENLAA